MTMHNGFVCMFSILLVIFAALFLNLLVAKICDRRRRRSAQPLQVRTYVNKLPWATASNFRLMDSLCCLLYSQHKQLQDPYKSLCTWTGRAPLCCTCLRCTKAYVSATLTGTLSLPLSHATTLQQVAKGLHRCYQRGCFALHLIGHSKVQEDCICSSIRP